MSSTAIIHRVGFIADDPEDDTAVETLPACGATLGPDEDMRFFGPFTCPACDSGRDANSLRSVETPDESGRSEP